MKVAFALISILAACAGPTQRSSEIGRSHVGELASAEATTGGVPPKPPEENATPAGAEPAHIAEVAPDAPVELEVPGFGPALVVLPDARSRPARILVGAHGAGDSPEWQCDHWGKVARGRYFVLCPRGTSLGGGGYYFKTHIALEAEFVAALAAAKSTYGAMVRPNDGVYTGYSQGATMGALMIVEHGAAFPHLVLVEGGSGDWTLGRAKRFAATGGKSVALVCGGSACARRAEAAAKTLASAGLRARAEHVPGGGHTYVGAVGERATELLEHWLLSE
jgi:predicted esterase